MTGMFPNKLRTLLLIARSMRFSLRALMLLVTLICCVLAYGLNWHRQREQFVKQQKERSRTMISGSYFPAAAVRGGLPGVTSPYLFTLLKMYGYGLVEIYLSEQDTTGPDKYFVLTTHPDYARAKCLFPEATIHPVVETRHSGLLPARVVNPAELTDEERKHLQESYLDLMPRHIRKKLLKL